ncbi:putative quinol monooxygenase [Pokkaliibacter sp. CJK22405]|uniref:putative quinol monooxygenase n=1 Tax=Pokkaliibacter sp. CJK22405 TaxID=3384615 RepID=UPI0039854DEA
MLPTSSLDTEQGITVLAFIRAREGRNQALGEALQSLIAASRQEAGCHSFEVHQSLDDPSLWFSYEHWQDIASQQAHFRTSHMKDFIALQNELVDGVYDLFHYQRLAAAAVNESAIPNAEPETSERNDAGRNFPLWPASSEWRVASGWGG